MGFADLGAGHLFFSEPTYYTSYASSNTTTIYAIVGSTVKACRTAYVVINQEVNGQLLYRPTLDDNVLDGR